MIDINEKFAKEILDFLVKRAAKNNSLCKDYDRCSMSFIEAFLFVIMPHKSCYDLHYYSLHCVSSLDSIDVINSVNSSYKDVLEVMLENVSNGSTIMLSDHINVFERAFECLEQILVEKDLEESIS